MFKQNYIICTITLLAGGSFFSVYANANDPSDDAPNNNFSIGTAITDSPRYSGSDEQTLSFLPIITLNRGLFFLDSTKGLGYDLKATNGLYFEHTLGYDLGRSDQKSSWRNGSEKLKGMGKIKGTTTTSFTIGYQMTSWLAAEAMVTLPLDNDQGIRSKTAVKGGLWQDKSDTFSFETDLLLGDNRYNNSVYGVTTNQSANSGFHEYSTSGGVYGQSVYLDWAHQITTNWSTDLTIGYTYLNDKVSESPIVLQRGSTEVIFAVMYLF